MNSKPIEVFCGTGGVGKTTLATSRALFLASTGKRVLLITIDPAKRLKQVLNMQDTEAGEVKTINSQIFGDDQYQNCQFDALLVNPSVTIRRIAEQNHSAKDFDNHIIKILTRPYGGMNEIMAIIEVQHHLSQKKYNTIVLDTPPGKHFIDFLLATQKINKFFDKTFVEIFKYLGKSFQKSSRKESQGILSLIVKTGIKKLLSYLEKVTGPHFINDFVNTIVGLYNNKGAFIEALKFQENLKDKNFSQWFLVTSVEQQKFTEASEIQREAQIFMQSNTKLAINKCLAHHLNQWETTSQSDQLTKLRDSMRERENRIKESASANFEEILEFPEVLASTPGEHVRELAKNWARL